MARTTHFFAASTVMYVVALRKQHIEDRSNKLKPEA